MSYKSDIEIAREAKLLPIQEIGAKLDIPQKDLLPFGHDKAKVSDAYIKKVSGNKDGKEGDQVLHAQSFQVFQVRGVVRTGAETPEPRSRAPVCPNQDVASWSLTPPRA